MKKLLSFAAAAALVVGASLVVADDIKSGLEPGAAIGAFDVVKYSGAADDGVSVGDQLCYRCKYGARPMVMVFARKCDARLVGLLGDLDKQVASNKKAKFAAFCNLMGEDREGLEAEAKKFGEENKFENVPVVVPVEFENGPADYGINPEAEVTVIIAEGGKVVANHAVGPAGLNDDEIKEILDDVAKVVQ